MSNNRGWFKHCVMSFSFDERRNQKLKKYKQRVIELKNMESDELDFEYITLKSEYEHKKNLLTIFLISIALAVLMNIWKYFFIFVKKMLQYTSSFKSNGMEIAQESFMISTIIVVFITFAILFILLMYMNDLYKMQKELMIIEAVKNKQAKDKVV